jgi:hypothetical protein
MEKLMPCSKSTNVSSPQSAFWISARVTTSPARFASRTSKPRRLGLEPDLPLILPERSRAAFEPEFSERQITRLKVGRHDGTPAAF